MAVEPAQDHRRRYRTILKRRFHFSRRAFVLTVSTQARLIPGRRSPSNRGERERQPYLQSFHPQKSLPHMRVTKSDWKTPRLLVCSFMLALAGATLSAAQDSPAGWRAGAASAVITPERPMRMGGYGIRTDSFTATALPLQAKVLALEDARGARFVLVTLDLIGARRELREDVERQAQTRFGLPPESLMLNASHTHCGPEYGPWGNPRDEVDRYNLLLRERIVDAIGRALADLAPAQISYSHARAGFAMNRRRDYSLPPNDPRSKGPNPRGPVDHDVPVLKVEGTGGKLRAIAFGYACHNTTLGGLELNGDYAGFAQAFLQETHPGVTALFVMGCGADQNPHPRANSHAGTTMVPGRKALELAQMHGQNLGLAVEAALNVAAREIKGPLRMAYEKVELDFTMPTREDLQQRTTTGAEREKKRAAALLAQLDRGELKSSYGYPVQVVRFGDVVTLVALGSEVVVDYSLRLKREIPGEGTWVAGYSNDYFGYMPSRRVLAEGGYEGGEANREIHPGYWAGTTEDRIVGKVHQLHEKTRSPRQ